MEKIRINACTSNTHKYRELVAILGDEFEVVQHPIELVELQGNPLDIVNAKAIEAYSKLKEPLFVEDVSLFFNAFNGLPGPYVKDFVTSLGAHGMYKLLKEFEDKSAIAICNIAFIDGNNRKVFTGEVKGRIVEPRGDSSFGWNAIFEVEQQKKAFGEMADDERNKLSHRYLAAKKLREFLLEYYKR